MQVLVLSDSHGNVSNMERAVEQSAPDMILHLGDCWRDAEHLKELFPQIPLELVPGNCDLFSFEAAERLLFLGDRRVLICHGHTYGVKQSLLRASLTAQEQNLDFFLFGHTHIPLVDKQGKSLLLNPGSIGDPRRPSYGLLTITDTKADGRIVLLHEGLT